MVLLIIEGKYHVLGFSALLSPSNADGIDGIDHERWTGSQNGMDFLLGDPTRNRSKNRYGYFWTKRQLGRCFGRVWLGSFFAL